MKKHRNYRHTGHSPARSPMGLEASPGQDRLEEWEGQAAGDPSSWVLVSGLHRMGVVSALISAKQPDVYGCII